MAPPAPHQHPPGPGVRLLWIALLLGLLPGCAGFSEERHIAPFYSHLSTAGGGEEQEALGGAVFLRSRERGGPADHWGLRPFSSHKVQEPGVVYGWFLVPLGSYRRTPRIFTWQLLPVAHYNRRKTDTDFDNWVFFALPGLYWSQFEDGRVVRAWFPFAGRVEHFLSFDQADFFLFPLYARIERQGRQTWHFLWPIFSYSHKSGGTSWRVWPLYGRNKIRYNYERYFVLWPFFHFHKNNLKARPELHEYKYMFFPLAGYTRAGEFRSYTFLWPFFGYSHNPEIGFWAWDGPWPIVRLQRPGHEGGHAYRTRVWPLYSNYEGDHLRSRYWLWPFFARREWKSSQLERRSTYVLPFWQRIDRDDVEQGRSSYRKMWPLYQEEYGEDYRRFAFPALNPLWRTPVIDFHYAWIYELFRLEGEADRTSERGWLGIWRRERDRDEDRASLSLLWSRRRYSLRGEEIREYSLFAGLIRWRTSPERSVQFMWPQFPGPGWPLDRTPNSLLDRDATD